MKGSTGSRVGFKTAIKGAAQAARKKAFRKKLPVAISQNGEVYLVYPGDIVVKATPEAIQRLAS